MAHEAEVRQAKRSHAETILRKPNVVGVGAGLRERGGRLTDEVCLVALVERKVPKAALPPEALVPPEVDGVPTDVVQVGRLRAFAGPTERWRPAPGGVSVGHYLVTAGTLGCVVRDRQTGERLLLSNNHVLANLNDARPGDPILQPGALDGGREDNDVLARLVRFHPLRFAAEPGTCGLARGVAGALNLAARAAGSRHRLQTVRQDPAAVNRVDAAVARPLDDTWIADEILDIGVVGGVTPARLGMAVRKSGRSTGFTVGTVNVLDATVSIDFEGRTGRFEGQIITTPMSRPGDSGSLLVAADALLAVGLLFAGSEQATIYNPIQEVLDTLGVRL